MYGIEYYSKANILNEAPPPTPALTTTPKSSMNLSDSLVLTDQLAFKLQNLSKCPEHLIPKPVYTSSSVTRTVTVPANQATNSHSLTASLHSSTNSAKSNLSSKYYTDDFILLSEFSEIEGPKPLLSQLEIGLTCLCHQRSVITPKIQP